MSKIVKRNFGLKINSFLPIQAIIGTHGHIFVKPNYIEDTHNGCLDNNFALVVPTSVTSIQNSNNIVGDMSYREGEKLVS